MYMQLAGDADCISLSNRSFAGLPKIRNLIGKDGFDQRFFIRECSSVSLLVMFIAPETMASICTSEMHNLSCSK